MLKRNTLTNTTLLSALTLAVLLAIAWLVYTPGLKGTFLFDDWANLPPLGAQGPIDSWHALITYLLSGVASATGRPVAMLSFLLDANNWPAPAEPFKYTNILIHLLNGALLSLVSYKLARLLALDAVRASWVAVLNAGLWFLHPLMVSTTLFVVQRMAMLAATFVLTGILCYLRGRCLLVADRLVGGYLWMTFGVVACGLLATLSKENGALLPLFILIIEYSVLRQPSSSLRVTEPLRGWRLWKVVFLYSPVLLLGTYLVSQLPGMLRGCAEIRNFSIGERLLTESRIVIHYLYVLFVPRAYTAGLFNDNIRLSTSLFHPWTTLPSILLIASLLALGWYMRRRFPPLTLAIFFYFGGQILESTFIPLELYFEHRNYLPATFLFFPLSMWLVTGRIFSNRARIAIGAVLLAVMAGTTWIRATLWGHPFEQAVVWARVNPGSPRAQTYLSLYLMRRGDNRAAEHVLERVAASHPSNVMVQLNLVSARCGQGGITDAQLAGARYALATAKVGSRVAYNAIAKFLRYYRTSSCPGFGPKQLESLIHAAMGNQSAMNSPVWRQSMHSALAELRLSQGRTSDALEEFKKSLSADPRAGSALYEAALFGTAHHPKAGLALLRYFHSLKQSPAHGFNVAHLRTMWLTHQHYYVDQLARMKRLLEEDVTQAHSAHASVHSFVHAP